MCEYIVEMNNIEKKYKTGYALRDFNFTSQKGKITALIGPNGAGKTTMIRLLTGLAQPTGGNISIFGKSKNIEIRLVRQKIGTLIEYPTFYRHMTGEQNLIINQKLKNVHDNNRPKELLNLMKLNDVGKKKVKDYSIGMKQRLGIAKALMSDPELLILDEPTNGLDPLGIIEFRQLIQKLNQEGKTIIICSHILSEMEQIASEFSFINNGKIINEISSKSFIENKRDKLIVTLSDAKSALKIFVERFGENNISYLNEYQITISLLGEDINLGDIVESLNKKTPDIKVKNIERKKFSLEDYFLEVVEKSNVRC